MIAIDRLAGRLGIRSYDKTGHVSLVHLAKKTGDDDYGQEN